MRSLALWGMLFLAACAPEPQPVQPKADPTKEAWYGQTIEQLAALNHQAERAFKSGKQDDAAAFIKQGEPLMAKILSVPEPTLAALEAASDLDELYGGMLLANRHYGWARMIFQRDAARWKNVQPETADTLQRKKRAEAGIAQCDREIAQ